MTALHIENDIKRVLVKERGNLRAGDGKYLISVEMHIRTWEHGWLTLGCLAW
jgi:hypothetical protein